MSEEQRIKEQCIQMAVTEMEQLLNIIGDLGYKGYKICMCRLKGYSYLQCAQKFGVKKSRAQYYWETCKNKGYDIHLKRMFKI
jgi:hypothetical protein